MLLGLPSTWRFSQSRQGDIFALAGPRLFLMTGRISRKHLAGKAPPWKTDPVKPATSRNSSRESQPGDRASGLPLAAALIGRYAPLAPAWAHHPCGRGGGPPRPRRNAGPILNTYGFGRVPRLYRHFRPFIGRGRNRNCTVPISTMAHDKRPGPLAGPARPSSPCSTSTEIRGHACWRPARRRSPCSTALPKLASGSYGPTASPSVHIPQGLAGRGRTAVSASRCWQRLPFGERPGALGDHIQRPALFTSAWMRPT